MPAPDRRKLPRPLPLHLASANWLWLSSRAALTSWPAGLPLSNAPQNPAAERLAALRQEITRRGTDVVAAALDGLIGRRAEAFITGLETYRRHSYRRAAARVPVRWRSGAARLLDYGRDEAAPVLLVPSLINRYYILDLLPERSFVRHLAAAGLRPLVLDWDAPDDAERDFGLGDYINGPLAGALQAASDLAGGPVALAGYCMGGLLALAAALRHPSRVNRLLLLATPWDFHAERQTQAQLLASFIEWLPLLIGDSPVPVAVIQSLFLALDPFLGERKFVRFAALDPASEAARGFVALEDWLNDGVKLAGPVARECAAWYRDNLPARGLWQVAGRVVRPEEIAVPTLVVLPSRDRIVPPRSAAPLAAAIPGATVLRPRSGHIGMMASQDAPETVWRPIADWLHSQSSGPSTSPRQPPQRPRPNILA